LDAGLIASAQAVEHYEITRYGTLKRWAEFLGLSNAVALLDATLQEEAATDEALTILADAAANQEAADAESSDGASESKSVAGAKKRASA